jgi:hypothetical protein
MKLYDVSQLPVMEDDRIVGILDESDVLMHVYGDEARFRDPVSTAMVTKLDKLDVRAAGERGAAAGVRARPRRHRHGRRALPRPDHPDRPAELPAPPAGAGRRISQHPHRRSEQDHDTTRSAPDRPGTTRAIHAGQRPTRAPAR